ncbi:hypothetical protein ACQY0O_003781 [Thecaphora frezii]
MPTDKPRASAQLSMKAGRKSRKSDREAHRMTFNDLSAVYSLGKSKDRLEVPSERRSKTHARKSSGQSLKLDLHGLDLGGDAGPSSKPAGETLAAALALDPSAAANPPFDAHLRSHSGGIRRITKSPKIHGAAFMHRSSSDDAVGRSLQMVSTGTVPEDSFALHLRSECADFNEIMPSNAILRAEEACGAHRSVEHWHDGSVSQSPTHLKQVLGGFASLGVTDHGSPHTIQQQQEPQQEQQQRREKRSLHLQSAADAFGAPPDLPSTNTPSDASDVQSYFGREAAEPQSYRWAYLVPRPCDPLKTLDYLSIDEMGLHSVDIGNLSDWEGNTYSADILCPQNKVMITLEWSVAASFKRHKKLIVVPETVRAGDQLSSEEQGYRTVVICDRLPLDEELFDAAYRSPFSKVRFELSFLRKPSGTFTSSVLLARPDVHRLRYTQKLLRSSVQSPTCPISPSSISAHSEPKVLPFYPVLRRSRSRPYIRDHTQTIRRSRSKPYLKASSRSGGGDATDYFAPSLPGAPGAQYHPEERWPSARSPASPTGSADSSRSSSATHTTHSSVGHVTTSYSQASTCGMSEAPVSESIRSKTSNTSPASPYSPSSAVLQGHDCGFLGQTLSPFETHQVAPLAPSPSRLDVELVSPTQSVLKLEELDRRLPTPSGSVAASAVPIDGLRQDASAGSAPRKERKIGNWFKKKSTVSQSVPPSTRTPGLSAWAASDPMRDSFAQPSADLGPRTSPNRAMALTRKALEQIEAWVERPASPESTIMGSRRGSECVIGQVKAEASGGSPAATLQGHEIGETNRRSSMAARPFTYKAQSPSMGDLSGPSSFLHVDPMQTPGRKSMMESRAAINASLARIYGWTDNVLRTAEAPRPCSAEAASAPAPLSASESRPKHLDIKASELPSDDARLRSRNTDDDENALLGLDPVSADALTMLIPMPLIGRPRNMPASRYMRVTFTPFGDPTPTSECSSVANSSSSPADRELSNNLAGARVVPAASTTGGSAARQQGQGGSASHSQPSSWYRRLGFSSSSRHMGSSAPARGSKEAAGAAGRRREPARSRTNSEATTLYCIESFRISGQILDAPDVDHSKSRVDPRIPRAASFPVVLGFCDGRRGVELVQEGFQALGLVPSPDMRAIPVDGVYPPLAGVTDLIIAACAAIIDTRP